MIRLSPHLKTEELLSTFAICCWMPLLKLGSLEFAERHWTEYGEILTDEEVNAMDWSTKVNY